jgi:hypothetical protein
MLNVNVYVTYYLRFTRCIEIVRRKPDYQVTDKPHHVRLQVECTFCCCLQSGAQTRNAEVIGYIRGTFKTLFCHKMVLSNFCLFFRHIFCPLNVINILFSVVSFFIHLYTLGVCNTVCAIVLASLLKITSNNAALSVSDISENEYLLFTESTIFCKQQQKVHSTCNRT